MTPRRRWRELAYRVRRRPTPSASPGAPGAGKSTLTDGLITAVARLAAGAAPAWPSTEPVPQVGVLAVDPTSPFSGGAILGDRVRMGQHALDPTVFIRSMATRGHLGGLSLAVPDAVRLLGAAGIGVVIVETVGVGQMEVEIASAADTTVVVVTPGWGDSMQANKAGLLEVADVFVINKADRPGVREARRRPRADARPRRAPARGAPRSSTPRPPRRGRRRAVGRRGPPPGPPRRLGPAGGAPGRPPGARSCAGCCSPAPRCTIDELVAGEEFTTAVKALVAGELDPYQAADRLLAGVSRSLAAGFRYGAPMAETFVTVERRPDGVALVRLDRPKANALSAAVLGQLEAAATGLRDDPPGAVVLWGGRRIFAAGADIVELEEIGAEAVGANFAAALGRAGVHPAGDHRGGQRLRSGRRARAGAGLRLPGVRRGRALRAARGAARRHPRRRRHAAAAAPRRLVAGQGADHHGAPGAGRGGAGDRAGEPAVAPDDVLEAALTWAAELAAGPVLAHGLAKGAVDRGLEGTLADGLAIEQEAFTAAASTEDAAAGHPLVPGERPGQGHLRRAVSV